MEVLACYPVAPACCSEARASLQEEAPFRACRDFWVEAPSFLLAEAPAHPSCCHEEMVHACPDASFRPGVALDLEVPSCLRWAVLKTSGRMEDPACPWTLVACREAPYSCEVQGGGEVRVDPEAPSCPAEKDPGETEAPEVPFDPAGYRGRAYHLDPSEGPCWVASAGVALTEGSPVEAVPWGLLAQERMALSLVGLQGVACSDPGVEPFARSSVAAHENAHYLIQLYLPLVQSSFKELRYRFRSTEVTEMTKMSLR